jgi:hypothetical protein
MGCDVWHHGHISSWVHKAKLGVTEKKLGSKLRSSSPKLPVGKIFCDNPAFLEVHGSLWLWRWCACTCSMRGFWHFDNDNATYYLWHWSHLVHCIPMDISHDSQVNAPACDALRCLAMFIMILLWFYVSFDFSLWYLTFLMLRMSQEAFYILFIIIYHICAMMRHDATLICLHFATLLVYHCWSSHFWYIWCSTLVSVAFPSHTFYFYPTIRALQLGSFWCMVSFIFIYILVDSAIQKKRRLPHPLY